MEQIRQHVAPLHGAEPEASHNRGCGMGELGSKSGRGGLLQAVLEGNAVAVLPYQSFSLQLAEGPDRKLARVRELRIQVGAACRCVGVLID